MTLKEKKNRIKKIIKARAAHYQISEQVIELIAQDICFELTDWQLPKLNKMINAAEDVLSEVRKLPLKKRKKK